MFSQDLTFGSLDRVKRLEDLLQLRKLYRNCLRAEYLLLLPSPVYSTLREKSKFTSLDFEGYTEEDIENEVVNKSLETIAEMQLTADELKAGLRLLSPDFPSLFSRGLASNAKTVIERKANDYSDRLAARVMSEMPTLPISSMVLMSDKEKMTKILSTAKKYKYRTTNETRLEGPIQRLSKAEKLAEKFVALKLQQVREIPPEDYLSGLQSTALYLKDLWDRLNGGGSSVKRSLLPSDLPRPLSTMEQSRTNMSQLVILVEKLEKKLKDASKAREAKLQKAGANDRLSLAFQMKMMDDEVLQITRLLAVRSLQLQMEYIYRTLEEEALEISEDPKSPGYISRQGSTEELSLLTAEFSLLEDQLKAVTQRLLQSPTKLVRDTVLQNLVDEIEDLRRRLGIRSDVVFGDSRLTWRKVNLQVHQALETIQEGLNFLARGVRLLGSDLVYSSRLFSKATIGGTLKPREVAALRRTARDILAFIPFAVILIVPLTPVGHVLVFGFLQRYFPEVFPSQFTNRRQDIMNKYDVLRQQLQKAQEKATQDEEEAELAQASEVVARLTAPISEDQKRRIRAALREMSGDDYVNQGQVEILKKLEEKVAAAELDTLDVEQDEEESVSK
eukprot:g6088.t1